GAAIVGAFVAGINAYIDRTEREPGRLPIEFKLLGIKPGRWTPEVVVSRHNGLFRNVTTDVQLAQLVRILGSERAREVLNLRPGHPRLQPDAALDLAPFRDAILGPYTASRAVVRFRPEDVVPEYRGTPARPATVTGSPAARAAAGDGLGEGSNNWVVSGD